VGSCREGRGNTLLEYTDSGPLKMDLYKKSTRSYVMSRIRGTNTKPELALRRALFNAGARGFRIHPALPGRPDIAFLGEHIAIFVDGCFWHGCAKCKIPTPQSNQRYWMAKLARNRARDVRLTRKLRRSGWSVLHFWEHQVLRTPEACVARVLRKRAAYDAYNLFTWYATHQMRSYRVAFDLLERINHGFQKSFPAS